MIERTFHLPRLGGEMEVFVAHPARGGALPSVILYMDMWGIAQCFPTSRAASLRPATIAC
jgi:dienelactone hydrolase